MFIFFLLLDNPEESESFSELYYHYEQLAFLDC